MWLTCTLTWVMAVPPEVYCVLSGELCLWMWISCFVLTKCCYCFWSDVLRSVLRRGKPLQAPTNLHRQSGGSVSWEEKARSSSTHLRDYGHSISEYVTRWELCICYAYFAVSRLYGRSWQTSSPQQVWFYKNIGRARCSKHLGTASLCQRYFSFSMLYHILIIFFFLSRRIWIVMLQILLVYTKKLYFSINLSFRPKRQSAKISYVYSRS